MPNLLFYPKSYGFVDYTFTPKSANVQSMLRCARVVQLADILQYSLYETKLYFGTHGCPVKCA